MLKAEICSVLSKDTLRVVKACIWVLLRPSIALAVMAWSWVLVSELTCVLVRLAICVEVKEDKSVVGVTVVVATLITMG